MGLRGKLPTAQTVTSQAEIQKRLLTHNYTWNTWHGFSSIGNENMGLRGKLPTAQTVTSQRLDNLDSPDWLNDPVAVEYWNEHAPELDKGGLLTKATQFSFAVLCDLVAKLRNFVGSDVSKAYLDSMRAYQQFAKVWRRLPTEQPLEPVTQRHKLGEFKLED